MTDAAGCPVAAQAVLDFWFAEATPEQWFKMNDAFDETVRRRFSALYERAAAGEFEDWRATARGCLALIVVLDQFPRNMFRGDARTFATDAAALDVMRDALARGFDAGLTVNEKQFLYLPLQHSEDTADQALSVKLNGATSDADLLKWAEAHRCVIDRFGRFPHRNAVLGRESTAEEAEFLKEKDSSF